jgi:hypothetical protein
MGLAVVASLATSLTGASTESECGGLFQMSCYELEQVKWEEAKRRYYEANESLRGEPLGPVGRANQWANEHLAVERAEAVWWRDALVDHLSDGSRIGWLLHLPTWEHGSDHKDFYYPCDTHYGDALSGGCVPDSRDFDCPELRSWGIVNIPVIGEDWMLLDDDGNGAGCDVGGTTQEAKSSIPSEAQDASLAELTEPACSMALTRLEGVAKPERGGMMTGHERPIPRPR